jgi:NAD-dependent oxidoreductase involved in siderophore biosynthesis
VKRWSCLQLNCESLNAIMDMWLLFWRLGGAFLFHLSIIRPDSPMSTLVFLWRMPTGHVLVGRTSYQSSLTLTQRNDPSKHDQGDGVLHRMLLGLPSAAFCFFWPISQVELSSFLGQSIYCPSKKTTFLFKLARNGLSPKI